MDRNPNQDRDRLRQIEQSDLSESRVNEDFVDWLKTKGPNWLLVILVALVAYMGVVRWKQHKVGARVEAWQALATADLPRSFEDVAEEHGNIGTISILARLEAAKRYLQSVRNGVTVTSIAQPMQDPANPDPAQQVQQSEPLTEEQRGQYLDEAQRLFQAALDDVRSRSGDSPLEHLLLEVAALDGLAATAEARGDAEAARRHYELAAEAAEDYYPHLTTQARNRAANIEQAVTVVDLPTTEQTGGSALVTSFESEQPSDPSLQPMQSLQQIIEGDDSDDPADATATAAGS